MATNAIIATIFHPDAIADHLADTYSLEKDVRCDFFRQGINDTYSVRVNGTHYFLRIYRHGWRTAAQVSAETDLLTRLGQAGLPVSLPVADRSGRMVQEWAAPEGVRFVLLFTAAPGEICKDTAVSQSRLLGMLTARLHNLTEKWEVYDTRPSYDVSYFLEQPLTYIKNVFGKHTEEMHFIHELSNKLADWLENQPCTAPFSGLCHGDLHPENVHFTEDGQATLFDFDCFGYGCRAYDLATFLWSRYLFASSEQKRQRTWLAFLDGYEQERPLPLDTIPAVLRFVVLRQLWVMGMHTGPFALHYGRRWLDEKYVTKHFGLLRRLASDFKLL